MTRNKQWDSILIKIEECKNDIQYIQNNASDIPMIEIDIALEKLSRIYERLLSLKLGAASTEETGFFAKNSSLITKIIRDSVFNTETETEKNKPELTQPQEIIEEKKEIVVEAKIESNEQPIVVETKQETKEEEIINVPLTNKEETKPKTEEKQSKTTKTLAETLNKESKSTIGDRMASLYNKKDIATLQQLKPIKDLKQAISVNDKIMFIREIFANDVDKYNATLNEINSCQNLDEALAILDAKLTINSENQAMQNLLELVYRRYM